MKIFILEDSAERINIFKKYLEKHELTIVSEAIEAIKLLEQSLEYDFFFLDHDLGGQIFVDTKELNTGSTVAEFLKDKDIKGDIVIHSFNNIGASNMLGFLPNAYYVPFNIEFLKQF
jgi:CheY-like chemotaxis protein